MLKDFTEMPVWEKAMIIGEKCFNISENLPRKEDYALTSQIRRSAESISANIAEGFGRGSRLEFVQFLSISTGSADELKSQLYRCIVRNYTDEENLNSSMKRLIFFVKRYMALLNI